MRCERNLEDETGMTVQKSVAMGIITARMMHATPTLLMPGNTPLWQLQCVLFAAAPVLATSRVFCALG